MRYFIFSFLILFLIGGASWLHIDREQRAAEFFSHALKQARVDEDVSVGTTHYRVSNGVVEDSTHTVSGRDALPALQLAYTKTLARRSPLFDLTGTDPQALKDAVVQLGDIEEQLAKAQETATDARRIRALYPLHFLAALGNLEEIRQTFLASGSDHDAERYRKALHTVIEAERRDLAEFTRVLREIVSQARPMRLLTLGGTITTESMLASLADIKEGISKTERIMSARENCIRGNEGSCDPSMLSVLTPDISETVGTKNTKPPALIQEIRDMLTAAAENPSKTDVTVVLASSTCIQAIPGPYYFLPVIHPDRELSLRFLNDIVFYPTDQKGPILDYLRTVVGISYYPANPVIFYTCPDVGSDAARVYATLKTAAFAQSRSRFAQEARGQLLSDRLTVHETDALLYIRAILREASDVKDKNELLALSLMFKDKSAGLETLVKKIVDTDTHSLRMHQSGVPFDIGAEYMFLTHSAFPSLFQSYNPSFGARGVLIHTHSEEDLKTFFSRYVRYSSLHDPVVVERMRHDLKTFYDFEREGR